MLGIECTVKCVGKTHRVYPGVDEGGWKWLQAALHGNLGELVAGKTDGTSCDGV